jgi:amino acid permease
VFLHLPLLPCMTECAYYLLLSNAAEVEDIFVPGICQTLLCSIPRYLLYKLVAVKVMRVHIHIPETVVTQYTVYNIQLWCWGVLFFLFCEQCKSMQLALYF